MRASVDAEGAVCLCCGSPSRSQYKHDDGDGQRRVDDAGSASPECAATEKLIRELLQDANPGAQLPKATEVADETPTFGSTTRETFLGWSKVVNFAGPGKYGSGQREFTLPEAQAADSFALGGTWQVETQFATPVGESASIRLAFHASQVRIVLAGEGEVRVRLGSGDVQTIKVSGTPRSYSIVDGGTGDAQVVDVEVSAGVEAYSFTFG